MSSAASGLVIPIYCRKRIASGDEYCFNLIQSSRSLFALSPLLEKHEVNFELSFIWRQEYFQRLFDVSHQSLGGKYTKSMSQLITDSPSVTEMKLQKTEPWPLNEFEKQFDLQHLPQKSQKHALKVFKKKSYVTKIYQFHSFSICYSFFNLSFLHFHFVFLIRFQTFTLLW